MEAALFVYFAGLVGRLVMVLGLFAIIAAFAFVGCVIWYNEFSGYGIEKEQLELDRKRPVKGMKLSLILGVMFCFVAAITPSEKTMYLMARAYLGQEVLTSEVSNDLKDIVGLKHKSYKQELEKEILK